LSLFLGQRIEKDPSIDRLIEIRTVLEKIRPIDHKLRYQIDKLVKTAVTGTTNASDPLNFKANPNNLLSQMNGSEDESDSESDDEPSTTQRKKKTKSGMFDEETEEVGKYVPPKLTSMPYDEDETAAEKQEKLRERARKRAINSTLIDEWKEEFLDTPVEISGGSRAQQMISRAMKERERYEEDNLTRLPMTKAEKHRQSRLSTIGVLGDEVTGSSSGAKKRKGAGKKKGGKKRKFH
jgi:U3 small nucleolar ribonucleoprotein protein LCP5